ncbi:MJ1255/VC2487 family glycosyltransferase [Vibrio genomosp. F10]|uniref:Glycosyltransferase n=1 Tax=Vibrio genomosp. F10 TaxID=723171 RepID=A0A1B9R1W7_9VIBR|nr:MJ1255/VC2487 family glycosyltransferase [Vibrio genomosp. F10]OCH78317.1 glycosyltransferase [Vibrio genomosp. F10]
MKILYGVQGTGNGHIARARAMSAALKARGLDVDYLFSGRDKNTYFSMEAFGSYQTRKGLTFSTENGQVSYLKTVKNNNVLELIDEIKRLDLSKYDLILNDFEPITAWAAKWQNKTCISISHQNAFRYSVPLKGASWFDKQLIHHFAPSDYAIGLHWYHFEQPILPPIVHSIHCPSEQGNFILVYLPFENSDEICNLLFRFSSYQFVCFHPDVNKAETIENVELRPLSHESFQSYLHGCNGVIANGGFELPSEALTLGKKLLLKPLSGQFEQQSNVATLDSLGLATSMEFLDASKVRVWLDEKPGEKVNYPDVAQAIAEWVHKGRWDTQDLLCRSLWEKVDFPSYVSNL